MAELRCGACENAAWAFILSANMFACKSCEDEYRSEVIDCKSIPAERAQRLLDLTAAPIRSVSDRASRDDHLLFSALSDGLLEEKPGLSMITDGLFRPDDALPVITFFGATGSGKSLLASASLRYCGSTPLVCPSSQATANFTLGIESFVARVGDAHNERVLVLDTEDLTAISDSESPPGTALVTARCRKFVYLFSDIIVYVHSGELKQTESLLRNLFESPAQNSGSQKPAVILVSNRANHGACQGNVAEFLAGSVAATLFSSFQVVTLPPLSESLGGLVDGIEKLKELLDTQTGKVLVNKTWSGFATQAQMRAFLSRSTAVDSYLDQSDLLRFELQRLPQARVAANLVNWFNALKIPLSLELGEHGAFSLCVERFYQCLPVLLLLQVARDEVLWRLFSRNLPELISAFAEEIRSCIKMIFLQSPCYSKRGNLFCAALDAPHVCHEWVAPTDAESGFYRSLPGEKVLYNSAFDFDGAIQVLESFPRHHAEEQACSFLSDFWRASCLPRWNPSVCLACCGHPVHTTLETCRHSLCERCLSRKVEVGFCPLCGLFNGHETPFLNDPPPLSVRAYFGDPFGRNESCQCYLLDSAIKVGDIGVCEWIARVYPEAIASRYAACYAAANGHLNALQWLHGKDKLPQNSVADLLKNARLFEKTALAEWLTATFGAVD